MNNDPPSSSIAPPPPLNLDARDNESSPEEEDAPAPSAPETEQQLRQRAQQEQRNTFLDHLIRNLDIMIYLQLSILYYMDPSLLRFFFRAVPHYFLFTPKPAPLPATLPTPPNALPTILVTNLVCLLWHLLATPPAAGEATRGYMHGGVVIDFVGQLSPVSRVRLVGVDLMCLALQVLVLGVVGERRGGAGAGTKDGDGEEARGQTHDAEERGVHSTAAAEEAGIELRPLRGRTGGDEDGELDQLLRTEELDQRAATNDHPLDTFHSGQHVIANLRILDIFRSQWRGGRRGLSTSVDEEARERRAVVGVVEVAGRRLGFRVGLRGLRGAEEREVED